MQTVISFFPTFFAHFLPPTVIVLLEYLDTAIHTYFVFALYLCSRNSLGFLTTIMHLYDNSPMLTAIFKLFPSVVNPSGRSTAQSFFTRIIAPYTLNTYQIHTKLCTFIVLYMLFICAKFQGNHTVH